MALGKAYRELLLSIAGSSGISVLIWFALTAQELIYSLAPIVMALVRVSILHTQNRCCIATSQAANLFVIQYSGRLDLNQRPLDPQSSALPNCATPRKTSRILI